MGQLIGGVVTGILFGILMQKARVIRYEKQVGAMRLMDFTIFKFMFSAIIVSMIGLTLMSGSGMVAFSIKSTVLGANIIGGIIFGIGWAVLGYCPGTAAGALGEGRWDVIPGIAGMIIGAALYAETYPFMESTVLQWGELGKMTLVDVTGINIWILIASISAIYILLCVLFEVKGR